MDAEEAKKAAEIARLNVVFEDKALSSRGWLSATSAETEAEVQLMSQQPIRDGAILEITRPKRFTKQAFRFHDKNADVGGVLEFRPQKDPNFKVIRENDLGIQAAPLCAEAHAQTTWNRSVNKAVQYEAATPGIEPTEGDGRDNLFLFLERAIVKVETALQQNESVDIFNETFRIVGEDEALEGAQADNELREVKNFADPTYSKSKALVSLDWMPKMQGMVAVSAVRNISFDQRTTISGQTHTSHLLLWDFRQLVRPLVILQSHHEILTFRFNKVNQNLVAGGCITGQVMLWDIGPAMASAARKNNRSQGGMDDDDDLSNIPVSPKLVSTVEYSHRKPVSDLFWLPPNTQINYRGCLVGQEHLDGNCYQFVSVAGDGMVMVWDLRYEQIAADELRHIAKAKHMPTEKSSNKEGGQAKILWAPVFKAHLKRLEGVGELSLNRVCCTGSLKSSVTSKSDLPGDHRSHLILGTEEGDIIFADICIPKHTHTLAAKDDEEEDTETVREFVRWIAHDHSRPSVGLQQSPFFPDILLSVSDWNFHIWKVGQSQPLFVAPISTHYLTAGAWSPTRPSVVILATAEGHLFAWDFTDSSHRASIELKATHARITSMEFLAPTGATVNTRQQLLAVGDDTGTLHVFEMPRNLVRPIHKEESLMAAFLTREQQRLDYLKGVPEVVGFATSAGAVPSSIAGGAATAGGGGHDEPRASVAHVDKKKLTATQATHTTTATSALAGSVEEDPTLDDSRRAAYEARKKEEEDFLKLEAAFITELGLLPSDLPAFARAGANNLFSSEKK